MNIKGKHVCSRESNIACSLISEFNNYGTIRGKFNEVLTQTTLSVYSYFDNIAYFVNVLANIVSIKNFFLYCKI